jgi:hypothetical protein
MDVKETEPKGRDLIRLIEVRFQWRAVVKCDETSDSINGRIALEGSQSEELRFAYFSSSLPDKCTHYSNVSLADGNFLPSPL